MTVAVLANVTRVRTVVQHSSQKSKPSGVYPLTYTFIEHHLANLRLQAFNYNAKQSRRWLRARVLSDNRGFVTKEAASQLVEHFQKSEYQVQHPRITDTVLIDNAKSVLAQLELEREAARAEQGYPERVQDWWAAPTMIGTKKRRKQKMTGKKHGATAGQGVSVEGLGDEVGAMGLGQDEEGDGWMEEEDGGVRLEEEFEGFESPVMMSAVGSVVGDGEEEEEEEEEE